jgi:hypothetical protein
MYSLLQCGIPANDLPITEDGELQVGRHQKWLENVIS